MKQKLVHRVCAVAKWRALSGTLIVSALPQFAAPSSMAETYPLLPNLCPQSEALEMNAHEYTDSGKVLFWLDNAVANTGRGPLHLLSGDTLSTNPLVVRTLQKIQTGPQTFAFDSVGEWYFDTLPGHQHWHYDGFAEYSIMEYIDESTAGGIERSSEKVGFCMLDHALYDSDGCNCGAVEGSGPDSAMFKGSDCANLSIGQGISVDWVDLYNLNLEGQFVDITGMDNGIYWLRSVVDPNDSLLQTTKADDATMIRIQIIETVDPYEANDSKASVDTMTLGKTNGSKLTMCGMPHTIDNLSIHQSYDFHTTVLTPDEDWFKFRLRETASSSHYVRIDFDHDLGNLQLQLLNATGAVLETSDSETDSEFILLDSCGMVDSCGPGWYYVRIYPAVKVSQSPNHLYHINYDYSLQINAPPNEVCGDVNDDGVVSLGDILHFNANCFSNKLACPSLADVDGNCPLNCVADLLYLYRYVFQNPNPSPAPDCTCQ